MANPRRKHAKPAAQKRVVLPLLTAAASRMFGYARVSTVDQNLGVQISALRAAGVQDQDLYVEKISAVNLKRPMFNLMMKSVERGDSLVIHALSRLGRDVKQIHGIVDDLAREGVAWRSTTEPHLDTTTAAGRLMLNVTGAMAQFERDQIRERTTRGMDECRRKGMALGRTPIVSDADARKMKTMRKRGIKVQTIARQFGCEPSTVYARTNKLKA
jgi:DNA invertase Pin-like site-specific DNA recombinase